MFTAQVFQFHKGTIRTLRTSHKVIEIINFNSIKVQLERKYPDKHINTDTHFNSIKVQLEQSVSTLMSSIIGSFQFHKGTIRTSTRWWRFASAVVISIP